MLVFYQWFSALLVVLLLGGCAGNPGTTTPSKPPRSLVDREPNLVPEPVPIMPVPPTVPSPSSPALAAPAPPANPIVVRPVVEDPITAINPITTPPTNPPVATQDVAPPPIPPPTLPPVTTPPPESSISADGWIDVQARLQQAGWAAFKVGGAGREHTWETTSPLGRWNFTVGHPLVYWSGSEIHLGHSTRESRSKSLELHPLDWDKSIRPLLSAHQTRLWTEKVIVIDPGHGGNQPGSRAIHGNQFEKELTLDWALRLGRILQEDGWQVVLTRTNDTDVALAERVDIADQVKASLFISLHFNASFPNQSAAGLETFCTTPVGLKSTLVREFPDDPAKHFPNNEFDDANLVLASRLHSALLVTAKMPDRGIRRARFMDVLRLQRRPAVLIEGGYLSNPAESRLIRDPGYRQTLAEAVALALTY